MKRSEMIDLLLKDFDGKYSQNTIHEILFSLESYGMLPPEAIFTDPGHFKGDSFDYRANKWEEE